MLDNNELKEGIHAILSTIGSDYDSIKPNNKLWRFQLRSGRYVVVEKGLKTEVNVWLEQVPALSGLAGTLSLSERQLGFDRSRTPVGRDGQHSGLRPVFGHSQLWLWKPATLDEFWYLVSRYSKC